ncbi:transcription factor VBP-like [Battus philenor]|uniref:transcription factor VBP-like n=1 Tax=Battus philenor TaxID=42288 RepID=UPI0035CE97AE
MALWTPYAEDYVLDLSSKCQRQSPPAPVYTSEIGYGYVHSYPAMPTAMYPCQPYPRYAPAPAHSPLSGESSYSYASTPLSPPASPPNRRAQPSSSSLLDVDSLSDDPDFQAFEKDALRAMAEKNGGTLLGNNPRMRRAVQTSQAADDSYRRQRERNNYAAKQSRDRRKLREIHLALKVTYLQKEIAKLKSQFAGNPCVRCRQTYPA